jgi:hypothetical protein
LIIATFHALQSFHDPIWAIYGHRASEEWPGSNLSTVADVWKDMRTWRVIVLAAALATAGGALAGCGVGGPAAARAPSLAAAGSHSAAAEDSRSPVPAASTSAVSSPPASAAVIFLAASAPVPFTGDVVGLTAQALAGPGSPRWLRLASVTISFGDGAAGTASQACTGRHPAAAKGLTVDHAYSRAGVFTTRVTSATICGQAGQPNLAYVIQAVQVLPSAPAASASWPRCTRDEVQVSDSGAGAGLGHVGVLFTLHNTSAVGCRLFGYAGLGLLGPGGQPLPTTVNRAVSGTYLFPAVVPHWVALAPGGYASFDLEYADNPWGTLASEPYPQACPAASQTEVTLPNADGFSVVPANMAPCGGAVWTSPVIPGRAWLQFPAG